jgi:DNA repair protein RadA/Sms
MARPQSRFVCQQCGDAFLRWEGQCRTCSAWNSLVETLVQERPSRTGAGARLATPATPQSLRAVAEQQLPRLPVGIGELDRVLGGGLVPGSLVLVGGEPGIGKSTLLLQAAAGVAARVAATGGPVLYATGEESAAQVHLRAGRLGLLDGPAGDGVQVVAEREVGRIAELARTARPELLVVDSIQTATSDALDGPAGSVGQVRESALRLMELAKGDGIAVVLVGHVTKDGSLAGPKTLEHLVDAVLNLEGERYGAFRILRATKNRFGSTEEVGVLEMRERGLAEVEDPARAFLVEHAGPAAGSVVAATLEGSRPLLVEIQALVSPAGYGTPLRRTSGVDAARLTLLVAVLGRRAGIGLSAHDVYVNVVGGLSVDEPALDLPIALALASSLRDRAIAPGTVAIGEVGLLGELRPVTGLERRLREAARLGFARAIVPAAVTRSGGAGGPGSRAGEPDQHQPVGLALVTARTLRDAVEAALGRDQPVETTAGRRP